MRVVFVLLILFETVNISSQTKQTKSLVSEIVDQLSLSENLQANIFNGNYNSSDVRKVLKDNRINYKAFYFKLRSSVNEDFSNTVNYAYSRANFLFDENEEVIYWLNEYSTYLRGLKNRINNNNLQPNYLAKNNSKPKSIRNKTITVEKPLTPIVKKVTPKKETIEEFTTEETTIVSSIESFEEIKKETIAKERSSNPNNKVQESKIDKTTVNNSIEPTEEIFPEEINKTNKKVKDSIILELPENNTLEFQETIIEDTQAKNNTEIVEEIIQVPSEENSVESQETTTEDTEAKNNTEIVEEIIQVPSEENSVEPEETSIEETKTNNLIDSNEELILEAEAPIVDNLNNENNIQNSPRINSTKTKELENTLEKNIVEETTISKSIEENSIEYQKTIIEETKPKSTDKINNEVIQEPIALATPEENIIKKEQAVKTKESKYELSYSAKLENELANKAVLYYTVRVKSVSNPRDGLKFLSEIKDDDAVWDEHTFHLFKDKENKNITNISIGKFVDEQKAKELMEYLKTKNITNPSIEIHENNVKSTASNVQPISKPINTPKTGTVIENPVNKAVKIPDEKKEVSSNKNLLDNISNKVDDSENYFSVQVGANNKISSTNIQGLNLDKEKLFFVNIEKGKYAMNYGKHEDYGSAHKIALEIHKKGLQTAFVTKYVNGVRVKISKEDYSTDKTSKKIISDDINQLGYIPIGPNDKGKFIQIGTIYNWDAHNFKSLYDQLERTIYYKIRENNSVIFLVGPLQENEVFIELRNVKQIISDAFIKTI